MSQQELALLHRVFGARNQIIQLEALHHIRGPLVDGRDHESDGIIVALRLSESPIVKSLECSGLIEKRKIFTLQVFHDLEVFGFLIRQFALHGTNGLNTGLLRSQIAPFAEDEFEFRMG